MPGGVLGLAEALHHIGRAATDCGQFARTSQLEVHQSRCVRQVLPEASVISTVTKARSPRSALMVERSTVSRTFFAGPTVRRILVATAFPPLRPTAFSSPAAYGTSKRAVNLPPLISFVAISLPFNSRRTESHCE